MKWRQGLTEASTFERVKLLELERKTRHLHIQEVAGLLCALSDSGIADCSALDGTASIQRWARKRGTIYVEIRAVSKHPTVTNTYRWRFSNLRRNRN